MIVPSWEKTDDTLLQIRTNFGGLGQAAATPTRRAVPARFTASKSRRRRATTTPAQCTTASTPATSSARAACDSSGPTTGVTAGPKPARASLRRVSALTRHPASVNRCRICPPTNPVAPVSAMHPDTGAVLFMAYQPTRGIPAGNPIVGRVNEMAYGFRKASPACATRLVLGCEETETVTDA